MHLARYARDVAEVGFYTEITKSYFIRVICYMSHNVCNYDDVSEDVADCNVILFFLMQMEKSESLTPLCHSWNTVLSRSSKISPRFHHIAD